MVGLVSESSVHASINIGSLVNVRYSNSNRGSLLNVAIEKFTLSQDNEEKRHTKSCCDCL